MKKYIYFTLFISFFAIGYTACSTVKSAPLNSESLIDDTEYIQSLLDSSGNVITIPAKETAWVVRPLTLMNKENKSIIFEPGCILIAKKGEFKGKLDQLLSIRNCKNINIKGYGAVLKMHKRDYWKSEYEKSQWRHGLSVYNTSNLTVEGLKIQSSGGDGIYIGQSGGIESVCKNITLKHLTIEDNHRQGISVISVNGLLLENCSVFGTDGTLPKAGIDFEPNDDAYGFTNVVLKNCTFQYNKGPGILIYLNNLSEKSKPFDMSIENCFSSYNGLGLSVMKIPNGVSGKLILKNTNINGGVFIQSKNTFAVIQE